MAVVAAAARSSGFSDHDHFATVSQATRERLLFVLVRRCRP
jgi:hypothetical protein